MLVLAPPPPAPAPPPFAARLSRSEYSLQGSDMDTVGSTKVIGCSPLSTLWDCSCSAEERGSKVAAGHQFD